MMDVEEPQKKVRVAPWVEKYRPEKVDDISHQDEVVNALKKSIEVGTIPHLLLHGPPGTGKTTTILAVARALYGPELYRSRILELNASDERGIKVVREKVKAFAQTAVGGQRTPGYPCPRFKLIVLDEADTMTPEAQSALRRVIETYSKVTRFCLICNYVTRVIEPLASRCAKFRFKPLPAESMKSRLQEISAKENVSIDPKVLEELMVVSGGDMRKAVTFLQSTHQLTGGKGSVTSDMIFDISGQVPPSKMRTLWQKMGLTDQNVNITFDQMRQAVQDIIYEGYPMSAILSQLHDDVVISNKLTDLDKALICEKIAMADQYLVDGASESIQLQDVAAFIMRRITKLGADADNMDMSKH